MGFRETIIEINKYIGEDELSCRHCGSVSSIDEVLIEQRVKKRTTYHASCPECSGYIKRLKQSKLARVFWKGSMIHIGEFKTGLLLWMLQVDYSKSEFVNDAISNLLWDRTEILNIKDIKMDAKELEVIERDVKYKNDLARLKHDREDLRKAWKDKDNLAVKEAFKWTYAELKLHSTWNGYYRKKINKVEKELIEVNRRYNNGK